MVSQGSENKKKKSKNTSKFGISETSNANKKFSRTRIENLRVQKSLHLFKKLIIPPNMKFYNSFFMQKEIPDFLVYNFSYNLNKKGWWAAHSMHDN